METVQLFKLHFANRVIYGYVKKLFVLTNFE
jgi:hypothetical protein